MGRSFDWKLDVLIEAAGEELPFDDGELSYNTRLLENPNNTNIPQISVSEEFIERHAVERITCRHTESFGLADPTLPDQDYEVQFSLDRTWAGARMEQTPDITTVELHRLEWDMLMAETTLSKGLRRWDHDMSAFFPPTPSGDSESGLEALLDCITHVQEFMRDAMDEKEPR